jgi:hypothetical protein
VNIKGHLNFSFDVGAILAILLFNCTSVIFNDFDYVTNNLYLHPLLPGFLSKGRHGGIFIEPNPNLKIRGLKES